MSEPDPEVLRLASSWLQETFPDSDPTTHAPSLAALLEGCAKARDAEWREALFPGHPGLHPSPKEAAAVVEDARKDAVAKAKAPPGGTHFPKARKALDVLKAEVQKLQKPEAQAYLPPKPRKAPKAKDRRR